MTSYAWQPFLSSCHSGGLTRSVGSHYKPSLQTSIQQEFLLKRRGQKASSSGSTLHQEQENHADLVKALAETWTAGLSSVAGTRGHKAVLDWAPWVQWAEPCSELSAGQRPAGPGSVFSLAEDFSVWPFNKKELSTPLIVGTSVPCS